MDASVAAAWFVPGQSTSSSDALLRELGVHDPEVPHLFAAEVRNAFMMAERRGRMDEGETASSLRDLLELAIAEQGSPDRTGYDEVLTLARRERLAVYDALYLWQAMKSGAALATRDSDLVAAAGRNGVTVLDLRA